MAIGASSSSTFHIYQATSGSTWPSSTTIRFEDDSQTWSAFQCTEGHTLDQIQGFTESGYSQGVCSICHQTVFLKKIPWGLSLALAKEALGGLIDGLQGSLDRLQEVREQLQFEEDSLIEVRALLAIADRIIAERVGWQT